MSKRRRWLRIVAGSAAALVVLAIAGGAWFLRSLKRRPPGLAPEALCRVGAYEADDGRLFALRQRDGDELRLVAFDGWTRGFEPGDRPGEYRSEHPPAARLSIGECGAASIALSIEGSPELRARNLAFDETASTFTNAGADLVGRLRLPPGTAAVPVVVLLHGSERDSALQGDALQFLLPARGIGVFVYDKRGTGSSGGDYTQDFPLLVSDATVAAREARQLGGERVASVGYFGASQGGWIAPLAAKDGGADFVVVAYGLAESPLAEDRDEVVSNLREAGFGDAATLAKARELTDATGQVMATDFRDGLDRLAELRAKYRDEPWFAHVRGEFTGTLLRSPNWSLPILGKIFDVGTSWEYDPRPALEAIRAPHLWVLGGADREAPSDATFAILREIQATHPNLDVARVADADHGMWVERTLPDGTSYSGYAPGYHELVARWIATHSLAGAGPSIETYEVATEPGSP